MTQCKWGARMRLNGEILPGFYCCIAHEGHPPGGHLLEPSSFDPKAAIIEWVELSPALYPNSKPVGRKDDSGKLRYDLVDPFALAWLVASLTYGVVKYEAWNWKHVEDWRDRYYSALKRHIEAWRIGEDDDDESGLPHLANAMFCVMCLTAMSAPRDMRVVVTRTKEAIRRWREQTPSEITVKPIASGRRFKCDHHENDHDNTGRCNQPAVLCCTCRRCDGDTADSFHSCAEHRLSQSILSRHRRTYPAHKLAFV